MITEKQKQIIQRAKENHGKLSGGRFGWNENSLRALEKKRLIVLVNRSTWDSEWLLTQAGWNYQFKS